MMDMISIIMDDDINQRIARRVRQLRADRALALDTLAEQSGVSRSMISLIERGETSATAVVLEKLATGFSSPLQLVEVFFPPKARVAYETAARSTITHQQIWVLQGTIEVTLGKERFELTTGDCLAMKLDRPIAYRNPTAKPARYAVAIVSTSERT